MTKTLYYAGQPGEGYGWGVCNKNLIRELGKLCDLRYGIIKGSADAPVFMPIADHDLTPAQQYVHSPRMFGYCFFEYPLGPKARENAKRYDLIFCGSTWCKNRLADIGVLNTEVLIQGVDHEIFKPKDAPQRHRETEFRIFSGGKFEYRKGQDIVLAAFKLLQDKYPMMRLAMAWFNPWPALINGMAASPHIKKPQGVFYGQYEFIRALCDCNGIDGSRIEWRDAMSQPILADYMRSTDLGVFPNRCEGGTNLVLMEYMACGKPALATFGTGHLDIGGYVRLHGVPSGNSWVECDPAVVADRIEFYYLAQSDKPYDPASASMQPFTWRRAAEQIVSHL